MHRPFRPELSGSPAPDLQAGSLLRRLHEDPQDTVSQIAGEIGARPATSLGEARAAAYMDGRLRRAGLRVSADAFHASAGIPWDGALIALLAAAAVVLYYWQPLSGLALASLALAALNLLRLAGGLLRRRRPSQNVIATRATDEPPRWRVVLLAPLDSPPATAWPARLLTTGARPLIGRMAACILLVLLALAPLLVSQIDARRALWYAQMLPAAYLLALAALEIWAVLAPATAGAVNHAGALAALLESADSLSALERTELWAVALGATDTGAGMADLLRRYPFDREMTLFVGLESLGGGRLSYVTRAGLLPQRPADPLLLRLVAEADAADPLIDAEPRPYYAEPALVHTLLREGRRALTIIGLDANGRPALRGSPHDTSNHTDAQALDRAVRLIVALVKRIDATA